MCSTLSQKKKLHWIGMECTSAYSNKFLIVLPTIEVRLVYKLYLLYSFEYCWVKLVKLMITVLILELSIPFESFQGDLPSHKCKGREEWNFFETQLLLKEPLINFSRMIENIQKLALCVLMSRMTSSNYHFWIISHFSSIL